MVRVAVYARVSTDHEDQKNSVENQEMYFMDYIEKQEGWELYKMYVDEGMAGLAQDESRRTSERVQFGVIQQMKKSVAFGNIMYGYEFKNGQLFVNKKEAEMVRKIFHWYLDRSYGKERLE